MQKREIVKQPDLKGKVMVVTRAEIANGYELVVTLARQGANVVVGYGEESERHHLEGELAPLLGDAFEQIHLIQLDFMQPHTLKRFVAQFSKVYFRLDALIYTQLDQSKSLDRQVYGMYGLVGYLMPYIKRTQGARVLNLTQPDYVKGKPEHLLSQATRSRKLKLRQSLRDYRLATVWFNKRLEAYFEHQGLHATANVIDTGYHKDNVPRFKKHQTPRQMMEITLKALTEKKPHGGRLRNLNGIWVLPDVPEAKQWWFHLEHATHLKYPETQSGTKLTIQAI